MEESTAPWEQGLAKGIALYKAGDHHGALGALQEAIELHPQKKCAKALLCTGMALSALQRHEEAIAAFKKAEADSPEGKYTSASLNRGNSLHALARYEEAIAAYEKAEGDSPKGKYPDASYNRGLSLNALERYEEAIAAYEKAEADSPEENYPLASYNRGINLHGLERFEEAVAAYEKAEADSPDGKYPHASHNLGVCLDELERYEEAIAAYEKAEVDSPEGRKPDSSHNRGIILHAVERFEEAVAACEKAEADSPGGKFASASYNRGINLQEQGRFEEAIAAYEKAEDDSPDRKYPSASYNRGISLHDLERFEEAVAACEKAESDSPDRKYPSASYNRGISLHDLERFEEAIAAYEKAENDSPEGKKPDASFNRGNCLHALERFDGAIDAFRKAITDSPDVYNPLAYLELSRAFRAQFDLGQARTHAFLAVNQNSRDITIVDEVLTHNVDATTLPFYAARFRYLSVRLNEVARAQEQFKLKDELRRRCIEREADTGRHFKLYWTLLVAERVEWPNGIAYQDRLRVAYITSYMHGKPWYTFHIIDQLVDGSFELDAMDHFFWLATAYLIAEPVDELRSIIEQAAVREDTGFGKKYHALKAAIESSVEEERRLDPYLLSVDKVAYELKGTDLATPDAHPWVTEALRALVKGTEYVLPATSALLEGLLAMYYQQEEERLDTHAYADRSEWRNLSRAIDVPPYESDVIELVRVAVRGGIPYLLVLNKVSGAYTKTIDQNKRRQLAVVLSAVIVSYNMEVKNKPFYTQGIVQWGVNTVTDWSAGQVFSGVVAFGLLGHIPIAAAVTVTTKFIWDKVHERRVQIPAEKVFTRLKQELATTNDSNDPLLD